MKNSTSALLFLVFASEAFSGGSVGGNPPSVQLDTLALMSIAIDELPKAYADQDECRRANARLSVTGTDTVSMNLEGASIQVRKLRDRIVDDRVSKEILSDR